MLGLATVASRVSRPPAQRRAPAHSAAASRLQKRDNEKSGCTVTALEPLSALGKEELGGAALSSYTTRLENENRCCQRQSDERRIESNLRNNFLAWRCFSATQPHSPPQRLAPARKYCK